MPFGTPITIARALKAIERRDYLLPGIQREFVWDPEQIARLFDSLLRGYPIGSFLFWEVQPESADQYQFYEFIRDFHERDRRNAKATLPERAGITAILDGQQRLSSLYIGLLGSYSERRRYGKRSASNYAKRRLYLELTKPAEGEDVQFNFQFKEFDADWVKEEDAFWYRVGHILSFNDTTDVLDLLIEQGLVKDAFPKRCLVQLHRSVTELPLVNFYTETDQALDRVLNIFIRVNSGGTPLSYSDLLLSVASAQWEHRDAREEIHGLVDQLNGDYGDFAFSQDFVLKSCLMLSDLDLRWSVENFNRANMLRIEAEWAQIAEALRLTVQLLASYGFKAKSLSSANALLPIAYYIKCRGNPGNVVDGGAYRGDRMTIRKWLNVVLLKRVFGAGGDTALRLMREAIRDESTAGGDRFPAERIADKLRTTGQALTFQKGELDGLLDQKYGGTYTFALLAMLYPTLDFRNHFHVDHVHPQSHFTDAQLRDRSIPEPDRSFFKDNRDRIANLQLLEGVPNMEKSNIPFDRWLQSAFQSESARDAYLEKNFIPAESPEFNNFMAFYRARKERMLETLERLVSVIDDVPVAETRPNFPAAFHPECIARVNSIVGLSLVAKTDAMYEDPRTGMRVFCAVSRAHSRGSETRYWFAFRHPHRVFLEGADDGYAAFGCGSPELILMIPAKEFLSLLDGMGTTPPRPNDDYWHVELYGTRGHLQLEQREKGERLNVTKWVLQSKP